MIMESQRPSNRQEFEVAIICALALEFDAISLLFDQFWDEDGDPYGRASGDPNYYTTGRFGKYNVVLALLSHTDKITAASAAASLRTSYCSLRLALFVGICSGVPQVPNGDDEILLGDVVVSSAVVQYDLSEHKSDKFVHKDTVGNSLGKPNKDIRNLLITLNTELNLERLQKKTIHFLKQLQERKGSRYRYPGITEDGLFEANYHHEHRVSLACACSERHEKSGFVCEGAIHCFCGHL